MVIYPVDSVIYLFNNQGQTIICMSRGTLSANGKENHQMMIIFAGAIMTSVTPASSGFILCFYFVQYMYGFYHALSFILFFKSPYLLRKLTVNLQGYAVCVLCFHHWQ